MARPAAPLFQQLARSIADAINKGSLDPGDLLPPETALARRHGVSRHTVREALGELRSRGLVESRQGVGTRVVRRRTPDVYQEAYSSIEELTRAAKSTPVHARNVDDVRADENLALTLRARAGQRYVRIIGVRYDLDSTTAPVAHVEVYVDSEYGDIRDHLSDLRLSVAETIEKLFGLSVSRIEQEITVEMLTAEQADLLQVEAGTPALCIGRWYAADNGRVFEIAFSRYPIGRFSYRNVLVRKGKSPAT